VWGLTRACGALGYDVRVAQWTTEHKGIDDLLKANGQPERTLPATVPQPEWTIKVSSRILADAPMRGPGPQAMTLKQMRKSLESVSSEVYRSS
jgi:hypothetical protein